MHFQEILAKYRAMSFSERDKGARFERLMAAFLKVYPPYAGMVKRVWLWRDFPYRRSISGQDVGIDLVALTVDGEYWAVQCKCTDESVHIDKPAVDSFLATSSKTFLNGEGRTDRFALRLWISTTNRWGSEAENAIRNQSPEVKRIGLAALESAPVDWEALDGETSGERARLAKKILREHQ